MDKSTKIYPFTEFSDERGVLSVIEHGPNLPFLVRRAYFLHHCSGFPRGGHAHKKLKQFLFCSSGSFRIKLDYGYLEEDIYLEQFSFGILLDKPVWRELYDFSTDAVCVVLASEVFDPDDYIHNKSDFLEYLRGGSL